METEVWHAGFDGDLFCAVLIAQCELYDLVLLSWLMQFLNSFLQQINKGQYIILLDTQWFETFCVNSSVEKKYETSSYLSSFF